MKTAPFLTALNAPLAPERHLAQVVVVAHAAEHEIRVLGGIGRSRRGVAAVFLGPGLGLGAVAIVDGEIVPALFADVPRHGVAHHAQPDPSHLGHVVFLLRNLMQGTISEGWSGCQALRLGWLERAHGSEAQALAEVEAQAGALSPAEGTAISAAPMSAAAAVTAMRTVLRVKMRLRARRHESLSEYEIVKQALCRPLRPPRAFYARRRCAFV